MEKISKKSDPNYYFLIPRKLLEELAPEQPMNQDEQGGCVWCGCGPGSYGYATRDPKHHMDDCPYIITREILEDG